MQHEAARGESPAHPDYERLLLVCVLNTQKVRRFCDMMFDRGHEVILYAGTRNEACCSELVTVVRGDPDPSEQIHPASWDPTHPLWRSMEREVVKRMRSRAQRGDYLCIIGGNAQQPIAAQFPEMTWVEYGIGYEGVFAPFRVFESYAWMHAVLATPGGAYKADGRFYDTVIPNSYDPAEFPAGNGQGEYLLYIGRLEARKGVQEAIAVAERTNMQLVVAGSGSFPLPATVEYVGLVGPEERARLMGAAVATLVPTLYVEPFGGVAVESMMCGTPAITTDWGAFTETVEPGLTGWRCRDLGEFAWAVHAARLIDREAVRRRAHERFSTHIVGDQYHEYFLRLEGLRGGFGNGDWYGAEERPPASLIAARSV